LTPTMTHPGTFRVDALATRKLTFSCEVQDDIWGHSEYGAHNSDDESDLSLRTLFGDEERRGKAIIGATLSKRQACFKPRNESHDPRLLYLELDRY
jgi:hypothetical protein